MVSLASSILLLLRLLLLLLLLRLAAQGLNLVHAFACSVLVESSIVLVAVRTFQRCCKVADCAGFRAMCAPK